MKFLIVFCLSLTFGFSQIQDAPEKFSKSNRSFVFVDFIKAHYKITYDYKNKSNEYLAIIEFEVFETGFPIIDIVTNPTNIQLNDLDVELSEMRSPDRVTTYRFINQKVNPGIHTVQIMGKIEDQIKYHETHLSSGFWMSDLTDRRYLEQFLPTNLEFDHYPMTFDISVNHNEQTYKVYSNAKVKELSKNHFRLSTPSHFTSSSLFYHLTRKDRFPEVTDTFTTQSGKIVPIVIYAEVTSPSKLTPLMKSTKKILTELENNFGEWPHDSLTIYRAGSGGMEYAGATITSNGALGHELTHSYYARGVMPKNGNAGWIDEAIASWRDGKYKEIRSPGFFGSNMGDHSQYKRTTDRKAYSLGAKVMGHLNYKTRDKGGLKIFLQYFFQKYVYQSVTTRLFLTELNQWSGQDFTYVISKFIYGGNSDSQSFINHEHENPIHKPLTKQELYNLL